MSDRESIREELTTAHTNLNFWAIIQTLCENSLVFGASKDKVAEREVARIARKEGARWGMRYEAALRKLEGKA